jgi:carbamoyl-phosphate synthase small subunit
VDEKNLAAILCHRCRAELHLKRPGAEANGTKRPHGRRHARLCFHNKYEPGKPEPSAYAVNNIRAWIGFKPMFRHLGINQPVKNLLTGKVEVTSQNYGFGVAADTLDDREVEFTHIIQNDGTLEGFHHRKLLLMAVQCHPEAVPRPHDAGYLFEEFRRVVAGF